MPQPVVATIPAVRYSRYMVINKRLLLVDRAIGIVVAEVTDQRITTRMKPKLGFGS